MAKNTNSCDVTNKSLFPTLMSSSHQLYSFDSETNQYIFRKSQIEKFLRAVEEKDKHLPIATVGIIGSQNSDHHMKYTDLLIQYLEHRLQTNEKIVETFIRDFDENCERRTNLCGGVYFWPKIYKITSKKLERCRLLILFFDGVASKTLEVLASALCSQMYVFKDDGKHMVELEPELHLLRDSFNKTSNVTLRSPCTTVIKSENDPPRSFRMFLKDWVDFHLDFFKHKETMFSDWEQLMRYLVKTEGAINAYISRTELKLLCHASVFRPERKSKSAEQLETGPFFETPEDSTSQKDVTRDQPLLCSVPGEPDLVSKIEQDAVMVPVVVVDQKDSNATDM